VLERNGKRRIETNGRNENKTIASKAATRRGTTTSARTTRIVVIVIAIIIAISRIGFGYKYFNQQQ